MGRKYDLSVTLSQSRHQCCYYPQDRSTAKRFHRRNIRSFICTGVHARALYLHSNLLQIVEACSAAIILFGRPIAFFAVPLPAGASWCDIQDEWCCREINCEHILSLTLAFLRLAFKSSSSSRCNDSYIGTREQARSRSPLHAPALTETSH